jgi:tetratricopeptide (TPR) repeat protein
MSIIHEALKKAEREREPGIRPWSFSHGMRTAHRQRWSGVIIGMVAGVTMAAAVSIWLWLQSSLSGTQLGVVTADPLISRAHVAGTAHGTNRHTITIQPLALAGSPEAPERLKADDISPPSTAVPLAPEAQATADTAFERAREAESKAHWTQAESYYRQALAWNPTLPEAHNNLGNLYIRQQQLSAAIGEFRAAMALNPNYARVRNNLGSAYFLSGAEELAIQEFIAALRIDSTYVSPYYNLASLYARRGDVDQAVGFLTKALALDAAVVSWVQEDSEFDGIRGAPEFQRLRLQAQVRR